MTKPIRLTHPRSFAPANELERILGRQELRIDIREPLRNLGHRRILITGGSGSFGTALLPILTKAGARVSSTDLIEGGSAHLDVRDLSQVVEVARLTRPSVIFHLAGAKHAPEGEVDPEMITATNTLGTANVLRAARAIGARTVLASTCKACNPETAYGASKLIAERMVLNAGGTIARFFNVVETQGNVFQTWRELPSDSDIPFTNCSRYFISLREAVGLLVYAAILPTGRYIADPGEPRMMIEIASDLYPERMTTQMKPRRGDRIAEPHHAFQETIQPVRYGLQRVVSPHDWVS